MPFALRSCNKCGGDLEFIKGDIREKDCWKCMQCSHEQEEPGGKLVERAIDPVVLTKPKRKYIKTEKFFGRYPQKREGSGIVLPQDYRKSDAFWRGYRQAVLDMSPKTPSNQMQTGQ